MTGRSRIAIGLGVFALFTALLAAIPAAATAGGTFVDDDGSIFESDIEWMATAGITKGCNPPTNTKFCPDDKVTRGQMAAFMRRALSCTLPGKECGALQAIYDEMGGASWTDNTGWNNRSNPCTSFGVECKDGRVVALDLPDNGLTGSVPTEIVDLTELVRLHLADNAIVGSVPVQLITMTTLVQIRMSGNGFTGPVPAGFGSLSALKRFELARNSLTGSIPPDLGSAANLEVLSLTGNELTGQIPSELGVLSKLKFLSLDDNALNGSLPTELGNLTALSELRLKDNDLSGAVPPSLMNLVGAQRIELRGQSGCLTAATQELSDWLTAYDPDWADGCP